MFAWFISNLSSIIVGLVIFGIFFAIIGKAIYNRKHHKGGCSSCGGQCGCCPNSGMCHSTDQK